MKPIKRWLLNLSGSWYNHDVYFRYRIHQMSQGRRTLYRLLLLPVGMGIGLTAWAQGQFIVRQVEYSISTRCTLRCRDCGNLIPFFPHPADTGVDQVIKDIDEFLGVVDRVRRFIVMGGETFLYPDLYQVVAHLINSHQVGTVHLYTNGTITPSPELLQLLKHPKIMITVSCFPDSISKNRRHLVEVFDQNHIHYINEQGVWADLGGMNPEVDTSEQALKARFKGCCRTVCHNILDGEYYLCPRAAHGWRIGQYPKNDRDSVIFRARKDRKTVQQELKQLFKIEYIEACRTCRGDEGEEIPPGIQMDGGGGGKILRCAQDDRVGSAGTLFLLP